MKRILSLALAIGVAVATVMAQSTSSIKYVSNSFKSTSAADVQAGGKGGLGKMDMTKKLTEFAPSHNDEDIKSGIIRIGFQNVANNDIENKVTVNVNPGHVNKTDYIQNPVTGSMECWVHIDPRSELELTVTVDGLGSARVPGLNVKSGEMYAMTFISDEKIPITINSNVANTSIWIDGIAVGTISDTNKPLVVDNIAMGKHKLRSRTTDGTESEAEIEVSKSNVLFNVDLRKRYDVRFESNEKGVGLYEDNRLIGALPLSMMVEEGPHTYMVKKTGFPDKEYSVNISGPGTHKFDIRKYKSIEFMAMANNTDCHGASVYINNELQKQKTPTTPLELAYGKYNIRMSYNGRDKSGSLTVDENTSSRYTLVLPAQHRRFNPFDIDYHKRYFGFTAAYVQKWMSVSSNGSSIDCNYFGEEKRMSGLQLGIPIQPYFGYGFGMNTGLFYELYFLDHPEENVSLFEHNLYMPLDLQYRLPLGEEFAVYANGGIGTDWSIATTYTYEDEHQEVDYDDWYWVNHFNFSAEAGLGIQYRALQVSFMYQWGLTNNKRYTEAWEGASDIKAKIRKMQFQISLVF